MTGLFTYGRRPTAEVEAAARRRLAAAKIKKHVREAVKVAPRPALTGDQCAEIVSQLLAVCAVDDTTTRQVVSLVATNAGGGDNE